MSASLPRHIAFIMDGNGRWAQARGLPRALGHAAGAETARRIVRLARRRGIACLTLYAFSTENWSRPEEEVASLMRLLGDFIAAETAAMVEQGIALRILGDAAALPGTLAPDLARAVEATRGGGGMTLSLAVNYGGRDEIVRAARAVFRQLSSEGRGPEELDAATLSRHLDTAGLPDPDMVVRTAGERRLSNFLVWQAAYAELVFSPRTWPEFSEDDFDAALAEYAARVRTFGGMP